MSPPAPTRPEDKVPLKAKIAYGASGVVDQWANQLPGQLINPIFATGLGLSPALIGVALFVFRFYDAMIDPLMGWISDNTRSRWGRRKPYLLVGALLTGITFPLMWHMGRDWGQGMLLGWLIGTGLLFYTCFTVWAMPYHSMALEMTPDYHERTSVSSWRSVFGQVATLMIGWAWYITQLPFFGRDASGAVDPIAGAQAVSIVAGVIVVVFGVLPVFFVKERYYAAASRQAKISLRDNFRQTLRNRPFLITAGFTLCFVSACAISGASGYYLRLYYVAAGDQELAARLQGVESTLFSVVGFASVPVINWFAHRFGKHRALLGAMGLLFVGFLAHWWTYTPAHPWLSVINSVVLAPAFLAIWQLIPAINCDNVDFDELHTGERREGAFASIFSWTVKAGFSIGAGIAGPLILWCGFELPRAAAQAPAVFHLLRVMDVALGASLMGAGILLLMRYPLNQKCMGEIRVELEARRGRI